MDYREARAVLKTIPAGHDARLEKIVDGFYAIEGVHYGHPARYVCQSWFPGDPVEWGWRTHTIAGKLATRAR